jgi:hypothetical protein
LRAADKLRGSRARRRNLRHEAQKNLRAYADPDAAEAHEEKIDRGQIADAEAKHHSGEIAFSEKESRRESDSFRDAVPEFLRVHEKEKIFAEPIPGIFSERIEQKEEEAQGIADPESVAGRIACAIGKSECEAGSQRNSQADGVRVAFTEEERCARDDLIERDRRLREISGAHP